MNAAQRIGVRIAEALACIEAVAENNHARLILSARRGALQDALADIKAEAEQRSRIDAMLRSDVTLYAGHLLPGDSAPSAWLGHPVASPAIAKADSIAGTAGDTSAPPSAERPSDEGSGPPPRQPQAIESTGGDSRERPAPNPPEAANGAGHQDPAQDGGPLPPVRPRVAPSAPAPESGQPSAPAPDAGDSADNPVWTRDRIAMLRQLWPDDALTAEQIWHRLNDQPGLPIASVYSVRAKAKLLKLAPRSPAAGWTPERRAAQGARARGVMGGSPKAVPAAAAPPATEPPPEPSPPKQGRERRDDPPTAADAAPGDVLADVPADDLAEARDMMRKPNIGAKALSEYFGWDLPRAQAIAAAIRDEQTRKAA